MIFIDGIVVGAAFSKSLNLGISTSVAVFSYRVPKQLGKKEKNQSPF